MGRLAVPARWRRILHGHPGLTGERLVELAHLAATGARPDSQGWPSCDRVEYAATGTREALVPHPRDGGVLLGDVFTLDDLPGDVTAVVSLCRVGRAQVPAGLEHVVYWLIDVPDPSANPNLDFVLADAAHTVAQLRAEGHVVLLHCVARHSRTPAVAIAYSMLRGAGRDAASEEIRLMLPGAAPNPAFRSALGRLAARDPS